MGHWELDWSEWEAKQCWEELRLLWNSVGVRIQLRSKRVNLGPTIELDADHGKLMKGKT